MSRALVLGLCAALAGCAASGDALPLGSRAEDCATCHVAQYSEWSESRHAASATSPLFEALLPRVAEAWGPVARDRCVSCHAPGHGGDEAIGCVSCHAAVGNRGEQNAALVVDLDAPLVGPFSDADPTAAHGTTTRTLLRSAVLCGTCHEVRGPGLLDEPTLSEHRGSPQAESGTSCVDCHMRALDAEPVALGATRARPRREHRFVGVDPAWGGSAEDAARAEVDARELLASALTISIRRVDAAHAEVLLQNVGAGHDLPTGAAFLRDIWVDVDVIDARGRAFELPRVIELGTRMLRDDHEVALVTDADRLEPRGIAPGASRAAVLEIPADATLPVRVEAAVRARAVRADTLQALSLPSLPVLEVAAAQSAL